MKTSDRKGEGKEGRKERKKVGGTEKKIKEEGKEKKKNYFEERDETHFGIQRMRDVTRLSFNIYN